MSEVTQIRHTLAAGDPDAASQLLLMVYDELRKDTPARRPRLKKGARHGGERQNGACFVSVRPFGRRCRMGEFGGARRR